MSVSFGSRIKLIRNTNQLNQVEFSKIIGISQGTLSELEQDKYNPSMETILFIHNEFKTNLTWLLLGDTVEINKPKLLHSRFSEKEIELLELFERLPEFDKEDVIQSINLKLDRLIN
jgi:transcriptional regulator with XRE-family HTH domain